MGDEPGRRVETGVALARDASGALDRTAVDAARSVDESALHETGALDEPAVHPAGRAEPAERRSRHAEPAVPRQAGTRVGEHADVGASVVAAAQRRTTASAGAALGASTQGEAPVTRA